MCTQRKKKEGKVEESFLQVLRKQKESISSDFLFYNTSAVGGAEKKRNLGAKKQKNLENNDEENSISACIIIIFSSFFVGIEPSSVFPFFISVYFRDDNLNLFV